jgi:hypothetical protein
MNICAFSARWWQTVLVLVALPLAVNAADVPAWVLFRQNSDASETILSTDSVEMKFLTKSGWQISAAGNLTSTSGANKLMVHRMVLMAPEVSRRLGLSPDEVAANRKAGYVTEGAMGYASMVESPGAIAVRRYRKAEREIWLGATELKSWAESSGWKSDGAVFWLLPAR